MIYTTKVVVGLYHVSVAEGVHAYLPVTTGVVYSDLYRSPSIVMTAISWSL